MQHSKINVLVVAAHPDDEVLGCGGTLAKHAANGDDVFVLILGDGVTSRPILESEVDEQTMGRRNKARQAAKTLGIRAPEFHSYPDNRMDSVDLLDIVKHIEAMIHRVMPEIVYTHHASDVNIDHRVVHDAVITAVRPQPGHCVKKLLFFEVLSSTEWRPGKSMATFSPDYFVDISESVEHKLQAVSCYEDEMREFPHPRSLEACLHLLKWRGATVGVQ
ncbi:MAG: PIG-L family deacetylase, partial [Gammaproteobacteria bacterium]|nr:PIG-L family deacetylase [Gammaproteobacteria bacterium]